MTRRAREFAREAREVIRFLGWIATWFLLAFLAGSFVGAFFYGVFWVAGMAPR